MFILKLLHKLGIIHLVWLKMFDGTWEWSIKGKENPEGWACYRFPLTKTGFMQLLSDGKITGIAYIDQWEDFK